MNTWRIWPMNNNLEKIFRAPFLMVSKPLIKIFGLDTAIFLCELYSEYTYWLGKKQLTYDGYFYSTVENVEYYTSLSRHKQNDCVNTLMQYGIIKKVLRGLPCKRYFKFEPTGIDKLLVDIEHEIQNDKLRTEKILANDFENTYIEQYACPNNISIENLPESKFAGFSF